MLSILYEFRGSCLAALSKSKPRDQGCLKFSRFTLALNKQIKVYENSNRYEFQKELSLLCMIGLEHWDFRGFRSPQNVIFNFSKEFPAKNACTHLLISCYFEDLLKLIMNERTEDQRATHCYEYLKKVKEKTGQKSKLILSFMGEIGLYRNFYVEWFIRITLSKQTTNNFIGNFTKFAKQIGFDGIYIQHPTIPSSTGIIVENWIKRPWIGKIITRINRISSAVYDVRMQNQDFKFFIGIDIYHYNGFDDYSMLKNFDLIIVEWNPILQSFREFDRRGQLNINRFIKQSANKGLPIAFNVDTFGHIEYNRSWEEDAEILRKLSFGSCNLIGPYDQLPYYWVLIQKDYKENLIKNI